LFKVETVELKYIHIGIGVCVDLPYLKKKTTSDSTTKFSETDIINMLQSLIDNIVVIFGGRVFQPTDGIPIGINCASLLADLFHYLYDAGFSRKTKRS
jgi:hypothetical protein